MLTNQEYWNEIGPTKEFEDPIYLDKWANFVSFESLIIEYGCGYGRLLKLLDSVGYSRLIGFDLSPNMLARGRKENPQLKLKLLKQSGEIPFENESTDAVILSTVLCSVIDKKEQTQLIQEILRILRKGGILYLTDFLLCDHPKYQEKYERGVSEFGEWGIYKTNESLVVRHHKAGWILELLHSFDIQWFEQFSFKTMNQNPARTFHCIATK
jgi:SAM-dependent methyltransferase